MRIDFAKNTKISWMVLEKNLLFLPLFKQFWQILSTDFLILKPAIGGNTAVTGDLKNVERANRLVNEEEKEYEHHVLGRQRHHGWRS